METKIISLDKGTVLHVHVNGVLEFRIALAGPDYRDKDFLLIDIRTASHSVFWGPGADEAIDKLIEDGGETP